MYQVTSQRRRKTILSKYILQSAFNVLAFTGVTVSVMFCLSFVYKYENVWDMEVLGIYLLLVLLVIRYSVRLVSVVLLVKSGVVGALATWMIVVVELLPTAMGLDYEMNGLVEISKISMCGQIYFVTNRIQMEGIIPVIFLTSVLEIGISVLVILRKYEKEDLI